MNNDCPIVSITPINGLFAIQQGGMTTAVVVVFSTH
jgi:hypothetical protein